MGHYFRIDMKDYLIHVISQVVNSLAVKLTPAVVLDLPGGGRGGMPPPLQTYGSEFVVWFASPHFSGRSCVV